MCLVLSLAFSHGAGNYIFTLFDNFAGSVPLLVIALFECIAVAYFYGLKRSVAAVASHSGAQFMLHNCIVTDPAAVTYWI